MVDYNEFVEFHNKHPDLDNTEYYAEFPETNKSTIRSWKSRAVKPIEVIQVPDTPAETEAKKFEGAEENESYLIQMLMNQTKTKASEFEGVDNRSKLLILKNRKRTQDEEKKDEKSGSNSSIMPSSAAVGQVVDAPGLWKYIEFDKAQNEIRMEIPLSKLMDPKQNKALRT